MTRVVKTDKYWWLKEAIMDYINNNPGQKLSSVDIMVYFKLRVDITFTAIKWLEEKGFIHRHDHFPEILEGWNGNHHYSVC